MLYAVEVMIEIKTPEEVILMAHTHCAAAGVIGLCDADVKNTYLEWGLRLQKLFPYIQVRVLYERHSECGEHHFGHEELSQAA